MKKTEFYRRSRTDLDGPLHGVRVLDCTTVWSGPMASCVLADLGADVLRIEMPRTRAGRLPPEIPGTGLSWFDQTVNRNKRSVSLDLRVPAARDVFLRLVDTVDVVVENFRPGTLAGWGIDYEHCCAVKTDIVFVSISGWGQFGPDATRSGYDPITQASSGWSRLNGDPAAATSKAPTFLADDLAGLHAAIGALAALRHRDRTGEGQHVDVSMLDALLFQSDGYLTLAATGVPLTRWGDQSEFVVPSNSYECRDGRVYLAIALDKQWRRFAAAIGRPELAKAPGFAVNAERVANRAEVNHVVGQWCAAHPVEYVRAVLDAADVPVTIERSLAEVACDPHVLERDMLQQTTLSNGTTAPITGPAVKFSRTPTRVRFGAPAPGSATETVLAEIGLSGSDIAALRGAGAI
ncbi:CaiB/BaiF CoA transferase family protein [Nocardia iowensis]|uniref:CoA transferase n=1 Tax=Nocardia iowensis TaxID=204891 RepID=A0ABX8RFU6_NOCIO|nr:CoA transferase [Nocardia iowensis]QXN88468.1 CoA transferase [Nocardia iowensis]